jgi:UDP:flavonoid glycosyltransferase YjiC (YdhE family)
MATKISSIFNCCRPQETISLRGPDRSKLGGCLAAECLGIPHVAVGGNGYSAVDFPDLHYFPGNSRLVAEPMARHRKQFGLPPDPDNLMPFRYLHLCFMPPAWDGDGAPRPSNTRFVRHASATRPNASLPEWILARPDQPTVLASLGTVFNATPGILETIIEGLAQEPVNLVVSIGPDQNPARFGLCPPTCAWSGTCLSPCYGGDR